MEYTVLYNGELLKGDEPYLKDNRSFRYGDGLFESIRVINGKAHNLAPHINRMLSGAAALSFELPDHYTIDFFRDQIIQLTSANSIDSGAKVRLHLFRDGNGAYMSSTDEVRYLVTLEKLEDNLFQLNREGLSVDIYPEIKKPKNILANLKTSNSLVYILALNYAKKNDLHDCFILNTEGHVIESSSSNIFLASNGVLYTPPLSDGCVGGTMRMNLINIALEQNIKVYESSITPQNLLVADEIILTNAIQGIRYVGGYKNKRYYNEMAKNLLTLINDQETNSKSGLPENSLKL